MKGLGMNYKYVEMPGEDHGSIIANGMPDFLAFLSEHPKPVSH
jgi:hypothetical protein